MTKAEEIAAIWKLSTAAFVFIALGGAFLVLTFLADCLFDLGWGYTWKDVRGGLGFMAWLGGLYLVSRAISRWTIRIYK